MKVNVKQVTDWERVANATRMTVNKGKLGKEPSDDFKRKIMKSEHSPIRLLEFDITCLDVPHYVAMHLVRHTQGVTPFVTTQREDRTGVKREERRQTDPVNFMLACNAQALKNISRKRLCSCADATTRHLWSMVVNEVAKVEPIVAHEMVPECIYRGFCPEFKCCGYVNTEGYRRRLEEYRSIEGGQ